MSAERDLTDVGGRVATPAAATEVELHRLLGEPLRARIVGLLAQEQLCTCHLVELTGAGQTNISNHLRALREAGLVSAEPSGRYTYYRLEPEVLRRMADRMSALADAATATADQRRPCP